MNKLIDIVQQDLQINCPDFGPGDTISVHVKVQEKNKERIQKFQGTVIKRKGQTNADKTFTVRKISNSIGVERGFPIHSPIIEKIELIRKGIVRRAKLYYLRGKTGHAAKIKHREGRGTKVAKKSNMQATSSPTTPEVNTPINPNQTDQPKQ